MRYSNNDSDDDDDVYFDFFKKQKPVDKKKRNNKTVPVIPSTNEIRYRSWKLQLPIYTNDRVDLHFEDSNSILLPNKFLQTLTTTPDHNALTFRVKSLKSGKMCFCGVDFHSHKAEIAIAPGWMFTKQLLCDIGSEVEIQQVLLPRATFIKLKIDKQNEGMIFSENRNIKALLEKALERFIVVFVGLSVRTPNPSNSAQMLELEIVELRPTPAVVLTNADPEVDFLFSDTVKTQTPKDNTTLSHMKSTESTFSLLNSHMKTSKNVVDKDDDKKDKDNNSDDDDDDFPRLIDQQQPSSLLSSLSSSRLSMSSQGHTLGSEYDSNDSVSEDSKVCENCNKRISLNQYRIHSLRCRIAKAKCPECGDVVDKSEMEGHNRLYHTLVKCPRCGRACRGTAQVESHECPLDRVQCRYCELEIVRRDLPEHMEVCGSRTTKCERCGKNVKNADLEEHVINNCMRVCPLCMRPFENVDDLQRHAASCQGFDDSGDFDDVIVVDDVPEIFRKK